MKIGVPKEIIPQEYRVGINPETAQLLIENGHELFIQDGAGSDSGYENAKKKKIIKKESVKINQGNER